MGFFLDFKFGFDTGRRRILLFLVFLSFVLFLFFLSGCGFFKNDNSDVFGVSFYDVKISDLNPEGFIFVDSSSNYSSVIPFFVEVKNNMFFDSDNFVIVPSNYNNFNINLDVVKDYFKTNPWSFKGEGLDGFEDVKTFDSDIVVKNTNSFPYVSDINFFVCSDVHTFFSDSVCFSPSNFDGKSNSDRDKGVCSNGKVFYEGQGAPIVVSSVETESYGDKAVLKFTIVNKLDGDVYLRSLSPVDECGFVPVSDFGKVRLDYVKIGGESLNLNFCSSTVARLGFDKKYQKYKSYTFECVFDKKDFDFFDVNSSFKVNVEILLSYSYSMLIKKEKVVVKSVV